jgi:hypothetical protein
MPRKKLHPTMLFAHGKPRLLPMPVWEGFIVINSERMALGIYGSALGREARTQADTIRTNYPGTYIRVITRTMAVRPQVGDIIDPLLPGQKTPLGRDM